MKKRAFSYFITPFGVLSFSDKYVFINGVRTKSAYKVYSLLKRFDSDLFSQDNICLFWLFDYSYAKSVLIRYLRGRRSKFRVTEVYEACVHKHSDIFHGQYSIWPPEYDSNLLPF